MVWKRLAEVSLSPPNGITAASPCVALALQWRMGMNTRSQLEACIEKVLLGVPYRDQQLWNHPDGKMIFRTRAAVDLAICLDLTGAALEEELRARMISDLDRLCWEFHRGGGLGFNPKIRSNWTANIASAAGFLGLILDHQQNSQQRQGIVENSIEKLHAWFDEALGENAWCSEGFNYLRYPLCTSGFAFLTALRAKGKRLHPKVGDIAKLYLRLLSPQGELHPCCPSWD